MKESFKHELKEHHEYKSECAMKDVKKTEKKEEKQNRSVTKEIKHI